MSQPVTRRWTSSSACYGLLLLLLGAAFILGAMLHTILLRVLVYLLLAVLLAAARLVSDRRLNREVLGESRRSEERTRTILANLPDISWTMDRNHRLVYISPKAEKFLGYSSEEILSRVDFLETNLDPDDRARLENALEALFVSATPLDEVLRVRARSGELVWVHLKAGGTRSESGMQYADGLLSDMTRRKQAEIDLQTKTALFEAQVDATLDGILVIDSNGRRILHNRRVAEMFAIPAELLADPDQVPVRNHMFLQMKDPDANRASLEYFYLHPEDAGRVEVELKNGTTLEEYSAPVKGHAGEYIGRLWTFRDISMRKRNEQALRAKTAFFEAQVNSTIDGILVVDENDRKIFTNRRFIEFFNVPQEILDNPENAPTLDHVLKQVKDPDAFLEKICYLNQHAVETSRDEIELKDGRVFDRYSASVIDQDWNYFGRIWSFRDITEFKKNEQVLRQLSAAVEQSPVSVVITDPDGNITYVNPRFTQITGYALEEVAGQNPRILNSGYATQESYRRLWETILAGKEWRGEFRNRKKSGEFYWEDSVITPIFNSAGKIASFLAVKEDVTERRALESELRQAQKLEGIGQLAAGIAHEINTPTQFVTDNLTFLLESWQRSAPLLKLYRATIHSELCCLKPAVAAEIAEAEQQCDLDFVVDEFPRAIEQSIDGARRVARIVRAMKEFSHPDSAAKSSADLNQGILSTITVARSEWKYVAEIETNLDSELPPIVCYPGEINQVILNLIVNAAHAIRDKADERQKGRIAICTRMLGDLAEISITDNGTGIPEEIQHRIYEPFFTTKDVGKGTGQGLAFSHSVVVKKHQGKIWFETELGRGTTFYIQLPIHGVGEAKEE